MAKFCSNGHQIEDSWEICPYCQRTGFRGHKEEAGAKTRLEFDASPQPNAPSASAAAAAGAPASPPSAGLGADRRTVLLSNFVEKTNLAGWVVAMDGEHKGQDFRVREGQTTIGSSSTADIVLRDQTVSAKHASIRCKDGHFFLTDLDSTNGTFVNRDATPISREEIKDNDFIRLGAVTLKFKAL